MGERRGKGLRGQEMPSASVFHLLAVASDFGSFGIHQALLLLISWPFLTFILAMLPTVRAQAVGLDDGSTAVTGGALLVEVLVVSAHGFEEGKRLYA